MKGGHAWATIQKHVRSLKQPLQLTAAHAQQPASQPIACRQLAQVHQGQSLYTVPPACTPLPRLCGGLMHRRQHTHPR